MDFKYYYNNNIEYYHAWGGVNRTATISADLSALQTDISTFTVSENVQVVGLGEASHGTKEYHQMKS